MKHAKLVFLGLVCCGLLNQHESQCTTLMQQPRHLYQPDALVIVFDLHEVLMKLDLPLLLRSSLYALVSHPRSTFKLAYDYLSDQELDLSEQATRNMFNAQNPIPETWLIASELKTEGFPLFLFSNIEPQTFKELQARYPTQFSLFQGFHTARSKELQKPSLAAYLDFEAFLKSFGYVRPLIIFIDDNKNNIAVARKIGWYAILYKNPQQLTKALEQTLGSIMALSLMQRPAMLN